MEETKGDGTMLVTTRIREEMRLAAVVQHIDHDTKIVPRGTYRKVRGARGLGAGGVFFCFLLLLVFFLGCVFCFVLDPAMRRTNGRNQLLIHLCRLAQCFCSQTPAQMIEASRTFSGLQQSDAAKLQNYLHCRSAEHLAKKSTMELVRRLPASAGLFCLHCIRLLTCSPASLISQAKLDPTLDFMDSLVDDIPRVRPRPGHYSFSNLARVRQNYRLLRHLTRASFLPLLSAGHLVHPAPAQLNVSRRQVAGMGGLCFLPHAQHALLWARLRRHWPEEQ